MPPEREFEMVMVVSTQFVTSDRLIRYGAYGWQGSDATETEEARVKQVEEIALKERKRMNLLLRVRKFRAKQVAKGLRNDGTKRTGGQPLKGGTKGKSKRKSK